jgi:hypothetical protein
MDIKKTRSITSFISSANRQANEYAYNFSIDYPDDVLLCRNNEYMEMNILSFDMPNTMYNINETNNVFEIITQGTGVTRVIPAGNYTVKTFMKQLTTLINNDNITITYNDAQNTYTFAKDTQSTSSYVFKPITMGKLIGLTDNTEYTINFTTGLINLINYSKVIVSTENISFYYSNIANKQSNRQLFNNIIFWKSKADVEPYQILKYNNEDGGNSFVYTIQDSQIQNIVFKLKNERDELITDAPDYLMVIKYNFYERQDITKSLISIDSTMKELYNLIIFGLNRLKLLL